MSDFQSIEEFLAANAPEPQPFHAVLEPVPERASDVRVTLWTDGEGCRCEDAFVVRRQAIQARPTDKSHVCCGKVHRVAEIRFVGGGEMLGPALVAAVKRRAQRTSQALALSAAATSPPFSSWGSLQPPAVPRGAVPSSFAGATGVPQRNMYAMGPSAMGPSAFLVPPTPEGEICRVGCQAGLQVCLANAVGCNVLFPACAAACWAAHEDCRNRCPA